MKDKNKQANVCLVFYNINNKYKNKILIILL